MRSFGILFEQRDFKRWAILVGKFLKYGAGQLSDEKRNNPDNWFTLVKKLRDDEYQKVIEQNTKHKDAGLNP